MGERIERLAQGILAENASTGKELLHYATHCKKEQGKG